MNTPSENCELRKNLLKNCHRVVVKAGTRLLTDPKLLPHIPAMKESVGNILGIPSSSVGITATTGEGLTGFGRGEGIQVFCILTFTKEI